MTMEKRKNSRTRSLNLINYIHYDESGKEGNQGMGRTLNVSRSGILLETHQAIDVGHVISMAIGLNDEVIDIRGRVKYSQFNKNAKYESGIEFIQVSAGAQSILDEYIEAFNSHANLKAEDH